MPCFDGYIGLDRSMPSRSGLYAYDLPGVELAMLQGLTKDNHDDYTELWEMIQYRAWANLVSDVSLALKGKFLIDSKLVTRETSSFKDSVNGNSSLAGITFEFNLPKYARVHILSVGVYSEQEYSSPGAFIQVFEEDENGELLYESSADDSLAIGRNTINIDQDFEVDKLFVAYDPTQFEFRETENKYYETGCISWSKVECIFPCAGIGGYHGIVRQINGGGLNVKFIVTCSVEKFVCENLSLFKMAYWYKIGVELADEQLLGNRLNRFTTMTAERAAERGGYFGRQYSGNVDEAVKSINVREDPTCFLCQNTVMSKPLLM